MAGKPALDEGLMIGTVQEARRDAAAVGDVEGSRVRRELERRCGRRQSDGLERGAAVLGDGGRDVTRSLEAALDLERHHAERGERRNCVEADEVLGREQVLDLAEVLRLVVEHQVIRQATRLGALAAVRRATTPRFRRQTLSGPCDAQRAMDEDLERQ